MLILCLSARQSEVPADSSEMIQGHQQLIAQTVCFFFLFRFSFADRMSGHVCWQRFLSKMKSQVVSADKDSLVELVNKELKDVDTTELVSSASPTVVRALTFSLPSSFSPLKILN